MGYPNQQIGWSQEAILLQQILKKLVSITKIVSNTTPVTTTTTTTV